LHSHQEVPQCDRSFTALALVAHIVGAAGEIRNEPLPITHMLLSEKDGKVKVLSSNARFEFRGELVDRWSGQVIDSAAKANRAYNYMDFSKINFEVEQLNPYYIGSGTQTVTVFVDPLCPYCKELLAQLQRLARFRFAVVPIGIMGPQSIKIANELACARDQGAAFAQLRTGDYSTLAQRPACDTGDQVRRLITAQLFGIRQVPFLLRHDGLVQRGMPRAGLFAWLEG
jgi:thiol:disulfide interchange protein DsbC